MDRIVLDTNIVLDYLSATREKHADAVMLFEAILDSSDYEVCVPAASIKDVYYILNRHFGREDIVRERLEGFCEIVSIVGLDTDLLFQAFRSDEPDFEDALVRVSAENIGAVALISRDTDAFKHSQLPCMDARGFCDRMID